MYGTIVAIEVLMATANIPAEALVEPALGWVLLIAVVAAAAGLLWLLGRGSQSVRQERRRGLPSPAHGDTAPWNLHGARHPV
jgi:hypothetical protein